MNPNDPGDRADVTCETMKIRGSGVPDEELRATFFDAACLLTQLGFDDSNADVEEFGCGYGTFPVPTAIRTPGTGFARDSEPAMIAATRRKVRTSGLSNVRCVPCDFIGGSTGPTDNSVNCTQRFNILHTANPDGMLREVHRIFHPGGKVGVIHGNDDLNTARGPAPSIHPRPEQRQSRTREAGSALTLPSWRCRPTTMDWPVRNPTEKTQ